MHRNRRDGTMKMRDITIESTHLEFLERIRLQILAEDRYVECVRHARANRRCGLCNRDHARYWIKEGKLARACHAKLRWS